MIINDKFSNILHFEKLNNYSSLIQFSTTISGGVSTGKYSSFNLSTYSGDKPELVAENRTKLANILHIKNENIYIPYQTHEDKILVIDESVVTELQYNKDDLLHGIDAVITNLPGICIGVTTADCVPILIYDPILKVLAAVHAGWRGTVKKLVKKTINHMIEKFNCNAENMIACTGPSISAHFFEVGNDVADIFRDTGFDLMEIGYKNQMTEKIHLDLRSANKLLMNEGGIHDRNIDIAAICTYNNSQLLFSARRQGIRSGRMMTGGFITKE